MYVGEYQSPAVSSRFRQLVGPDTGPPGRTPGGQNGSVEEVAANRGYTAARRGAVTGEVTTRSVSDAEPSQADVRWSLGRLAGARR